jgi:hypothetical protein
MTVCTGLAGGATVGPTMTSGPGIIFTALVKRSTSWAVKALRLTTIVESGMAKKFVCVFTTRMWLAGSSIPRSARASRAVATNRVVRRL